MLGALPFSDFAGGLHLLDQAAELDSNAALDLYNVRMGASGEVRSRGGAELFSAADATFPWGSCFYSWSGTEDHLIGGAGTVIRAEDELGVLATSLAVDNDDFTFAPFGAPTVESVYCANGEDLVSWDGAAFALNTSITVDGAPGAPPRPRAVGVAPWDNRLMLGGFKSGAHGPAGAGGSPSTVFFTMPGDPTVLNSDHRETVTPGDGEEIVAIVPWREFVFVFKQNRFFVFTGTHSIGTGIPVFDYYTVANRCGAISHKGVCAARDGVYFIDEKGVYRTTGGQPELVSWRLDPLFQGLAPPFYKGPLMNTNELASASLNVVGERIHLGFASGVDRASLVYDPRFDWWSVDSLDVVMATEDRKHRMIYAASGALKLNRHTETLTQDFGDGFKSRWRSSWLTLGSIGEKILARQRIWGEGRIGSRVAVDFGEPGQGGQVQLGGVSDLWGDGTDPTDLWADGTDPTDLWGSGTRFSDGWINTAWRGEVFSMELRSIEGNPWSVQRLENHVGQTERASTDSRANAAVT